MAPHIGVGRSSNAAIVSNDSYNAHSSCPHDKPNKTSQRYGVCEQYARETHPLWFFVRR